MAFKKLEKFVTPKGVAVYPRLSEPDTKFKPNGEFSCKVRLAAEESAVFIAKIDEVIQTLCDETTAELLADANPKTKGKSIVSAKNLKRASLPYKACVDDMGVETGEFEFNTKMNHKIVKRSNNETILLYPKIFDASTPPKAIPYGTQVWGGSIVKVAGELNPFYVQAIGVGVSLRMTAVQIIELVQGNGGGDGFGFGGEEGGYVTTGEEPKVTAEVTLDEPDEF